MDATTNSGPGLSLVTLFLPWLIISAVILFFVGKKIIVSRKEKSKNGKIRKLNIVFKILCCLGCIVDLIIVGLVINWSFSFEDAIPIIVMLIIPGILTQCIYFLPYLIANSKGHEQETAIFVLNLFAGWTVIAWIIALVWAFKEKSLTANVSQISLSNADEIAKFKNLLDTGTITEEEFESKKKELLNL